VTDKQTDRQTVVSTMAITDILLCRDVLYWPDDKWSSVHRQKSAHCIY